MSADLDRYVYPGGDPPNAQALADARAFINSIPDESHDPILTFVLDGEINFMWKLPGEPDSIYVDLGFHGDDIGGSYYAHDQYGNDYLSEGFPADQFPEELIPLVSVFHE